MHALLAGYTHVPCCLLHLQQDICCALVHVHLLVCMQLLLCRCALLLQLRHPFSFQCQLLLQACCLLPAAAPSVSCCNAVTFIICGSNVCSRPVHLAVGRKMQNLTNLLCFFCFPQSSQQVTLHGVLLFLERDFSLCAHADRYTAVYASVGEVLVDGVALQ